MSSKTRINRPAYVGLLIIMAVTLTISIDMVCGAETDIKQKPKIDVLALEKHIHELINKERRRHGLSALHWSEELNMIARKHSRDMAERQYVGHYSPEGNDFLYRYEKEGFECTIKVGEYVYQGAENIFFTYTYKSIAIVNDVPFYNWNTMEQIAETAVEGWMKSPGHRENILNPYWETEGIGIAITDDEVFVTQNFC